MEQGPSFSLLLVIIMVVTSIMAWNNPVMLSKWIMNPFAVKRRNEYYRFLSHGFIHANQLHLIFNALALYLFGDNVLYITQYVFGEIGGMAAFLGIFLLGIVVASIPTYWRYKDLPHYNSLGASGGVSTIVFFSVVFFPLGKMGLLFIPIYFNSVLLGIGYLIYSYYKDKQADGNVNHNAHFVGAIFGVLVALALLFLMPEAEYFFYYHWDRMSFELVSFGF